jgi:hypothetical protein
VLQKPIQLKQCRQVLLSCLLLSTEGDVNGLLLGICERRREPRKAASAHYMPEKLTGIFVVLFCFLDSPPQHVQLIETAHDLPITERGLEENPFEPVSSSKLHCLAACHGSLNTIGFNLP